MKLTDLAVITLLLVACAPSAPKAPREPDPVDASLEPAALARDAALADATVLRATVFDAGELDATSDPVDSGLPDAKKSLPPGMRESTVPCTTDDDCWSRGPTPVARPKPLRGKHFKPCVDGEYEPMCGGDRTCMTVGYRC